MAFSLIIAAVGGFIVGVIVNLIADYSPARRMHLLAKASPFVSESAIPPMPPLVPHAPFFAWSGWGARLTRTGNFDTPRWRRRLLTELAMALIYPLIVSAYGSWPNLPFFLFYAPVLVLIVIIDIEYRWILWETIWPTVIIAILEALLVPRWPLVSVVRGFGYGLGIMILLYFLGILFGRGLGAVRGRAVGRTVLGFGDVRLAALGGLLVGWPNIGFALLIMVFTGAIGALIFITDKLMRTRRYRGFAAIPYGPYVAVGIAVMLYAPWMVGEVMGRLFG